MKLNCVLSNEQVLELIKKELTREGIKFVNIKHNVRINNFDEPIYEGISFETTVNNS